MNLAQAFDLAADHFEAGRLQEAEGMCRQLLAQKPDFPEALQLLGLIAQRCGQRDAGVELLRRAVSLKPQSAAFHANLALALESMERLDEAAAESRAAVALQPQSPDFLNTHSHILNRLGNLDESMQASQAALALRPRFPEALNNLANVMRKKGMWQQAIATFQQSLAISPAQPQTKFHLALLHLLLGDFERGLPMMEVRWETLPPNQRPKSPVPMWDGSPLNGRRILLYSEQGFGDTIHFARYIPMVEARGGKVIVLCQPELRSLLQTLPGDRQVFAEGEPLPPFDLHCPLMSLMLMMGTRMATIPAQVPYLFADAQRAQQWRQRIADTGPGKKVGLAWSGSPQNVNGRHRSLPLAAFAPLAKLPVTFFSLQKGQDLFPSQQPPEMRLIDWSRELHDFADTAALIAGLDLVITIDTAVAHLAGAMGKPTWVLLSIGSDWRWFIDRDDSPWYPTMRLFRQPALGDWDTPLKRIAEELSRPSSTGAPPVTP
jgi:tetratricopeptide (TPR) repeat protein